MKMPLLSRARCPKCLAPKAERLRVEEEASVWRCVQCAHEFQVKILKLHKSG